MIRRHHAVRHSFTVIHSVDVTPQQAGEHDAEIAVSDEDHMSWHFCENHCSGNVIDRLADIHETHPGVRHTCAVHSADFIGRFDTLEEARNAGGGALPLDEPIVE